VIITGETTVNSFGGASKIEDVNADGKMDLIVGASNYSSSTGRVYIFYNDGSYPTAAASADVIITGQATSNSFGGGGLNVGDMNADGKMDLVVGASGYSSSAGRTYIFYSDGTNNFGTATCAGTPSACLAANADVIITGEASSGLGYSTGVGDVNADGRTDLIVGAPDYSSSAGRVYIFYNDGSIPTTAATADVIISGEVGSGFGKAVATGDFDFDGRFDLVVGGDNYSTNTGRAYIFYSDGTNNFGTATCAGTPSACLAANADAIITGEATNSNFAAHIKIADLNADGRSDIMAGAPIYSTSTGRAYIFYNDGSYPTAAASADIIITGEATNNYFGNTACIGDLNADGKEDLIVGAYGYSSTLGRIYVYETRDDYAWQIQDQNGQTRVSGLVGQEMKIMGESGAGKFGYATAVGDLNADGRDDLAVGAWAYASNTGRVYVFYNDGSLSANAFGADEQIMGETASQFGRAMDIGDFDADGKSELVVGAPAYNTDVGRAYVFNGDGDCPQSAVLADQIITGESGGFGGHLAIGDVDGNGSGDLIVSATGYASNKGKIYVFSGSGTLPTNALYASHVIVGEAGNDYYGNTLTVGDLNADGETDLVVGANGYFGNTGRVYIYYGDGTLPTAANDADIKILGNATNDYFGTALTTGDFNADGETDLAVGAYGYTTNTGRTYIFYNDGSIPTTAATADVTITGEATNNYFGSALTTGDINVDGRVDIVVGAYGYNVDTGSVYMYTLNETQATGAATSANFGYSLSSGDFNADGKTDLAVGAYNYSSSAGYVYIFYNDGSISTTATAADVIIVGEASSYFGYSLASGDFNADGKTDLAAGAMAYSGGNGRVYIFYNDGSIPTTAATADIKISGESVSNFGNALTAGDFNADGKTDLAAGAYNYGTNTGRTYIFYNDGAYTTTAATADVIITGNASTQFGISLTSGDFNGDGRTDIAVGGNMYTTFTGRTYIFYNDGTIPTTAATADVTITGENTSDNFGNRMTSGDFNADGKTDLAVGATGYASSAGRVYIFYNDGSIPTTAATADIKITGEVGSGFGFPASGDFNADGKTDLAVGATGYSTNTGRVYYFYNDGSMTGYASQADMTLTGDATGNYFGFAMTSGDFNTDGKTDLVVGAYGYSTNTGKIYVYISETDSSGGMINAVKTRGSVKMRGNVKMSD
jgi:hypothetical protein